ncbi:MAG: glycoside hydrolase family 2 protein [Candidatus Paceibacterota bacterium]
MKSSKNAVTVLRAEYPRPHFMRSEWHNLNGEWEFAFDDANVGREERWFEGKALPLTITVPFAYQTKLSGIHDKAVHGVVWYARTFAVPADWQCKDVLIHFGAVDYRSTVWVNGQEVGHNQGGHVPFSFDLSPYLQSGDNRLVVRVEDYQDPEQPRGKQSVSGIPGAVDYYCTTGIWQSVWLEPVSVIRIDDIRITPLFKRQAFALQLFLHAPCGRRSIKVTVRDGEQVMGEKTHVTTNATAQVMISIPNAKHWTPETPHLYDIKVTLLEGDEEVDAVWTYAGMRSVHIEDGKVFLNEKPRYLAMVLDQGYWPEGGMTAPSDEAFKADIQLMKDLGFNGCRKHQKIEDPRWLYWCDKMGLMVWGEMANARSWSPRSEELLLAEWERVVRRDYNHPSVISWVPMNESWGVPGLRQNHPGQYAYLERIVSITRRLDQFRPVVDNDGWEHTDITDICAIHDYSTAAELAEKYKNGMDLPDKVGQEHIPLFARTSRYRGQPIIFTEVGGFLMIPQDVPESERDGLYDWYSSISSNDELLQKYETLMEVVSSFTFAAGFCYTQLVDVEHEMNGLTTYDRQLKVPVEKIAEIHRRFFSL